MVGSLGACRVWAPWWLLLLLPRNSSIQALGLAEIMHIYR